MGKHRNFLSWHFSGFLACDVCMVYLRYIHRPTYLCWSLALSDSWGWKFLKRFVGILCFRETGPRSKKQLLLLLLLPSLSDSCIRDHMFRVKRRKEMETHPLISQANWWFQRSPFVSNPRAFVHDMVLHRCHNMHIEWIIFCQVLKISLGNALPMEQS